MDPKGIAQTPHAAAFVERRGEPRRAVEAGLQLQSGILCQVTDASLKGLCFQTWIELKEGDNIPFRLALPGGAPVAGKLRICWRESMPGLRPWRYGARLSFTDQASEDGLKAFMSPERVPTGPTKLLGRIDGFLSLVIEKKPLFGLLLSALGPVALIWLLQTILQRLLTLLS